MNKPTKILYLITKSNFFGAQKQVYELALEAKKRGYDVEVACGGTGEKGAALGSLATKLREADIKVHQIQHFMRDMSPMDDLRAGLEVIKLLFAQRPQILHVTSSKAGGIGAFAGRLVGIKRIIFTSHGLTMDETWRPTWQRLLITWGTWLTMMFAHHSIMISTETFKRAQKLPLMKNRVSLIFNGIAPVAFKNKAEARHTLASDVPKDIIWIGGVGELHPNKNWHSLIEAVAQLPTHLHLFIIGEGEERPRLEALVAEKQVTNRVHLLGYKTAAPYLKAFDIFVLPSKKEGLPYVLLEAGLAGLPTVATTLPGNYDIINHQQNGLLVAPEPADLKDALTTLLKDTNMATSLGAALHKTVEEKFAPETMFEKTFATYLLE